MEEKEEAETYKSGDFLFFLLLFRPLAIPAPAAFFTLLLPTTVTHNSFHKIEKPISVLLRRNRANLMLKHAKK
jgi:hypothetical protein